MVKESECIEFKIYFEWNTLLHRIYFMTTDKNYDLSYLK